MSVYEADWFETGVNPELEDIVLASDSIDKRCASLAGHGNPRGKPVDRINLFRLVHWSALLKSVVRKNR